MKPFPAVWAGAVLLLCLPAIAAGGERFTLGPADYDSAAIVCPADRPVARFAAAELQKHLALITGRVIPIVEDAGSQRKAFLVGISPPGPVAPLQAEEARYRVTPNRIYLYGEDSLRVGQGDALAAILDLRNSRVGTLFAVYDFLERELGVRWLEPGDAGIAYEPRAALSVPVGARTWISPFPSPRGYRGGYPSLADAGEGPPVPPEFAAGTPAAEQQRAEIRVWFRRMRLGSRGRNLSFGHAFTTWWARYGTEHPEYFALNGQGQRRPMGEADRVKVCPSCPGLARQAVVDWWARGPGRGSSISGCENDGGGQGLDEYCHCDACVALDALKPGERFGANLTDRYVFLWSRMLALARQRDPGAMVTGYAYADALNPPRVQRVPDGVIIDFVTRFNDDLERTRAIYAGWRKQGARKILFRPNDLGCEIGLPMGLEKRLFEHQALAIHNGALGTDHDALAGFWSGISGLSYYVLSKQQIDPSQSFQHWEDEYAAAFGPAGREIKAFYAYWRDEVFAKRLQPADAAMRSQNGEGLLGWEICGAYAREIGRYYTEQDFDITDGYLRAALAEELGPVQRRLVERAQIGNTHARLTFRAMLANGPASGLGVEQATAELLAYRRAHRDDLMINWTELFAKQAGYGDVCGLADQAAASRKRSFDCVRATEQPRIDGHLSEPFWQNATTGADFLVPRILRAPEQGTKAYLAYDRDNLYLALECTEPQIGILKEDVTARDGRIWGNNAVEIFVDPTQSRADYYQFIISSRGVLFDGRKAGSAPQDDNWNAEEHGGIEFAVAKGDSAWTLELRLPFATLGLTSVHPGQALNFNLCRERILSDGTPRELSSQAALFGGFQTPSRFVTLVLQ